MKKHNFNAGPSILPEVAIQEMAKGVLDLNGSGLSVLEISHRSKDFEAIIKEAESLIRSLLQVPESHAVVFTHGGASLNFLMVPYNLMKTKAAYLETGTWAQKAVKEAKFFGDVEIVASSKDQNFNYIPKGFTIPKDADYFHITTNNTIFGTQLRKDLDSPVPLIADASSDILSRPIDVSKYGMIYGGAQKNMGPAGVAFAIIQKDILGKTDRRIPVMLDYNTYINESSLYNTPSCAAIYGCMLTLRWLRDLGGIDAIYKLNVEKAKVLYDEIDRNKLFKATVASEEDRSMMNVTFIMSDDYKDKEEDFLKLASSNGMVGLKGHRSVGGFRASIYNAMPLSSVNALVDLMKNYEKTL